MRANPEIARIGAQLAQAEGVPMNRALRRASKQRQQKCKTQPRRQVLNAGLLLLDRARPYDPGEMVAEHILTRLSFDNLRDGKGTADDFDRVSMMMNIGLIRAEQIDVELVDIMKAGQTAFVRMRDRYQRGLSFGFDAEGLQSAPAALDAYEVIVDASSPLQMLQAIREAYKRISNGDLLEMPT
jgi:hypothetical protein